MRLLVLQQRVAHEDHLRQQLTLVVVLRRDLPVERQQLLQLVRLGVDAEANHRHHDSREALAVEHPQDDRLDRLALGLRCAFRTREKKKKKKEEEKGKS